MHNELVLANGRYYAFSTDVNFKKFTEALKAQKLSGLFMVEKLDQIDPRCENLSFDPGLDTIVLMLAEYVRYSS